MPIEEVSVTGKLLSYLEATVKWKPGPSQSQELETFLGLLEKHSALYFDLDIELAGKVAFSVRDLRRELEGISFEDRFANEARGLVQNACARFQAEVEAYSAEKLGGAERIYQNGLLITDLDPSTLASLGKALIEMRYTVKTVIEAIEKRGIIPPPGLEGLLRT